MSGQPKSNPQFFARLFGNRRCFSAKSQWLVVKRCQIAAKIESIQRHFVSFARPSLGSFEKNGQLSTICGFIVFETPNRSGISQSMQFWGFFGSNRLLTVSITE